MWCPCCMISSVLESSTKFSLVSWSVLWLYHQVTDVTMWLINPNPSYSKNRKNRKINQNEKKNEKKNKISQVHLFRSWHKTAIVILDASNKVTMSIAHIHVYNFLVIKTIHYVINVISTEAELFAIRYKLNQVIQLTNINISISLSSLTLFM